ncbi:DUF2235 domain-containing protein [Candidatus Methylospira mobilis]|uniref:DUF2235 domain-containing protein n=1 Tax=Candidatus Methylospira mobilis TaxID=1808979 RepID=A0A5Q0BLI1_9GAMM|nr:DUF2235 domain-containing protein [Candidatus Methylospira mobilis]QFY42616.1 DUF2235 domain-containing protein [Candidatus Methylospira mobilis]
MTKNLVVFCDGTWNRVDRTTVDGHPCPTNVLSLFEATLPADRNNNPQIVHYIEGVGTRRMERLSGGGFGYGISDNIKNAYAFIISNYEPGDRIFLFGFSRGAYTARSIAGLIRNMGILKREKLHLINKAYDCYKDTSDEWHPNSDQSKAFRAENTHQNETIWFLGVWDTVGALGAPFGLVPGWIVNKLFKCNFHDVLLSSSIESAYHALAIDERRWPFRPTLWTLNQTHRERNQLNKDSTGVFLYEQKWFPGVHSNVGGGYADQGLSDCSLAWMADKAAARGLNIDLGMLVDPPFAPDLSKDIDDSQTIFYRIATVLFVKLPGMVIRSVFPASDRPLLDHLRFNGDYVRPIDDPEDLSECAKKKLAINQPCYCPRNNPARELDINETVQVSICAAQYWNHSGVLVKPGQSFHFEASGTWCDSDYQSPPDGYENYPGKHWMSWFKWSRRCRTANWFVLIGAVGKTCSNGKMHVLGAGKYAEAPFTPQREGELLCFANDTFGFYRNNSGAVTLKITRIS